MGKKRFVVERSDIDSRDAEKYEAREKGRSSDEDSIKEKSEYPSKPNAFLGTTVLRESHRGGRCRTS